MRSKLSLLMLALVAIMALTATALSKEDTRCHNARVQTCEDNTCITSSEENLKLEMRTLWQEHIVWTKMFIISVADDNTADRDAITKRLMKNKEDLGNALKPYYGDEIGDKFADLIKEHLLIAADLADATKAGDNIAAAKAEKKWYENADEIAAFESNINPYWDEATQRAMLHRHLKTIKAVAAARFAGDYDADVRAYDQLEAGAMMMADSLADGIIEQFPDKFARCMS